MAVISKKALSYPFYLSYVSPHIEDKKVRYSLYAASSLAVAAAVLRYGTTKAGFFLGTAGLFAQGYQIVQLAKEIKNTLMSERAKNKKISQITNRVFTMSLICGIVMSGLNLSLIYQNGSLLLQGTNLRLLKTPTQIPYAWVKSAPSLIYHLASLASIGCFAIPYATHFISHGDDHFFGAKQYAQQIHALCTKLLNTWLLNNTLQPSDLREALVEAFPQTTVHVNTFIKSLSPLFTQFLLLLLSFNIHDRIAYFSNPGPGSNRLFPKARKRNQSGWETTKYVANHIFFYTLNTSLMAARLYYHLFPTAVYFGLGLMYPTSIQKEKTIKRTWEVAPDFIGMPLVTKCRYLFSRLSSAGIALVWWNIPGACLNGLYLAEDFRFYGRRFCQ
jgi:hypothetical protein